MIKSLSLANPSVYDPFSTLKNWGVGFDQMLKQFEAVEDQMSRAFKNVPGYPPFNIEKVDDNKYVIEMAVAGFGQNNIEIELADNVLTINGRVETTTEDKDYLYKGIADRAFSRKIALADTVEIQNAELLNGMLRVFLENVIPEHKKPKKIEVKNAEDKNWLEKTAQLLTEKKED